MLKVLLALSRTSETMGNLSSREASSRITTEAARNRLKTKYFLPSLRPRQATPWKHFGIASSSVRKLLRKHRKSNVDNFNQLTQKFDNLDNFIAYSPKAACRNKVDRWGTPDKRLEINHKKPWTWLCASCGIRAELCRLFGATSTARCEYLWRNTTFDSYFNFYLL